MNKFTILHSLQVLGLKPGADSRQIRAAFRKLVRSCHPDVAGVRSSKKFEQITEAYAAIKNLSDEELLQPEGKNPELKEKKESFFARWQRERAERASAKEAETRAKAEAERAKRINEEAAKASRISSLINSTSKKIEAIAEKIDKAKRSRDVSAICLRLLASREDARLLAVRKAQAYFGNENVTNALLKMLIQYPLTKDVQKQLLHHPSPLISKKCATIIK